ncbi:MAG: monovalent cation/H+ antiporter complex subunit F [Acidobacteriota bacterium]
MNSILIIILSFVSLATLLAITRIVIGPTIPDRAVGLDTATTITIALIVVIAQIFHSVILLDVAMVYALLSFLSVISVGRYLEGGF